MIGELILTVYYYCTYRVIISDEAGAANGFVRTYNYISYMNS